MSAPGDDEHPQKNTTLKDIVKIIVEKKRVVQWLIIVGGTILCIWGGVAGFLKADNVVQVFLAVVAAVTGVEAARD